MAILPTKKQKEVFDYVAQFIAEHGYAPSVDEIREGLDLGSKATVQQHLEALEKIGYLKKSGRARSLEILRSAQEFIAKMVELPLAGLITAGEPIEAIEEKEMIQIPAGLVRDQASSYVLKVRGDSMIDEGIWDGDYVVVERRQTALNGEVVVALIDGVYATLKKFYKEKGRVRLQPANSRLKPLYPKNIAIQGVVRAVFRTYAA